MKTTLSVYDFRDAFHKAGRGTQFSYEALGIIFDYLEEQEDSTGYEYELDVIGLCCELSESTPEEIAAAYNLEEDEDVLEFINDNTALLGETDNGALVYVQF